ncbi:MAG TPA: hypothetical protein VM778_15120 [Gemmatimonadota bacterium]|nr:hypothetical protein [Gemmatimonadota bacterium]
MRSIPLTMVLVLTGCAALGGGQARDPDPAPAGWTANIRAVGGHGHSGFAIGTLTRTGETRVSVTMDGGSAGGVHPWYVHQGRCGEVGERVGSPQEYPSLKPNQRGDASATATIAVPLDPDDPYSVQIHQDEDPETLVGCGNLVRSW